jgi:hypothetical protein
MDDIISGHFSKTMMEDWITNEKNLLAWRAATGDTNFEKTQVILKFQNKSIMIMEFNGCYGKAGVDYFEAMIQNYRRVCLL